MSEKISFSRICQNIMNNGKLDTAIYVNELMGEYYDAALE